MTQAGLELIGVLVVELQVCTTTPGQTLLESRLL